MSESLSKEFVLQNYWSESYQYISKWTSRSKLKSEILLYQMTLKYMHVFKFKVITLSSNRALLIRHIKETPTMKLLMLPFNYKPFYMPAHLHCCFCCHSWSAACCLTQFTMLFLGTNYFHSFCLSATYGKAKTRKRCYTTAIKVK